MSDAGILNLDHIPLGAIVAVCTLDDCFRFTEENTADLSEQERAFGDFTPGRYGFRLSNVRKLETPISTPGSLGLWDYEGPL